MIRAGGIRLGNTRSIHKENKNRLILSGKNFERLGINGTISKWSVVDTMVCTGLNWLASPMTSFFEHSITNWIGMAQERDQWRALENMELNLTVP
jgi:hypothetical protein